MRQNERTRDCLTIVLAAVLLTLLVRPFQNTPFLDDWVYAWSVENLLNSGRLLVPEWSNNIYPAQILWGWLFCLPYGFSFVALGVSTWVLAVGGLCGLYLLLRELDVPRRDALLGTATLGVYPVFAIMSVTFMTDVPFVSLTILASFAMVRAMRTQSLRWLVVTAVIASLAVAVRMVAVVTPMAMFLALVLPGDDWGRRNGRWAVAVLPLIVFAAVCWWYQSHIYYTADLRWIENTTAERITMLKEFALPLLPGMLGATLSLSAGTLGLALLPLSIACVRPNMLRRALVHFIALVLVLAGFYAAGFRYPLALETGSTWAFNELGDGWLVPSYGVPPVPAVICWAALAVGVLSLASATAVLKRSRWKRGESFLVLAIVGHFLLIALLWLIHDRYGLILVPYAIAVLLAARPPLYWRTTVVVLGIMLAVTIVGIRDHLAYNRALWQAVDALHGAGVPDRDINGGYMVNGWLQYVHPENAYRNAQGNIEVPWVNGGNQLPYEIANGLPNGSEVVETFAYRRRLGPSGYIYVLKRSSALDPSR